MDRRIDSFRYGCGFAVGLAVVVGASARAGATPNSAAEDLGVSQRGPQSWARPTMTFLGRYTSEFGFDSRGAEIVAYHPLSARLFVSNAGAQRIDVVDIGDPSEPQLVNTIDTSPFGAHANSVAANDWGVVAVAIEAEDPQAPGTLALFDIEGRPLGSVTVGAMPDMVTFTPDGRTILTANEAEPSTDYLTDPEGSVSIVSLRRRWPLVRQRDVRTADFVAWNGAVLDPSIRVKGPGASAAQDFEPEYIAVSADSRTAWVTLQENNALAVIDVPSATVTSVVGLGVNDRSQPGNGLDASDKDDAINIATYPISSLPLPDGIAAFRSRGKEYLITANEGDVREYDAFSEEVRCAELELDPDQYPDADELMNKKALGRLSCSLMDGDVDGDGDIDRIHSFGNRSFSIWDAAGRQIFDSGDEIEQTLAALDPEHFNSNNDDNDSFDTRSDNKGPEPEGVAVGRIRGRNYAFIGLERVGGILMYDLNCPEAPEFVQYLNTRDYSGSPEDGTAGDLAPEGLTFIPAWDSPNRRALLVVANEVSGTTAILEID